jgi:hypothetical protein
MILLTIAWGHWLSWAISYGDFVANLIFDIWLLRILWRQGIRKQLPWFVAYVVWELTVTVVGLTLWIASQPMYIKVSWWMEAVRVALLVVAVGESLLGIFKGFESLLRWSVLAVVAAVIWYSVWKGNHGTPAQWSHLTWFVFNAEFALRWAISGVTVVATGLMWFIAEPAGTREDAVITGAAMDSMGFVAWSVLLSFFGRKFTLIARYLPDVGYFIAAFYWIKIFQRPIQGMGLEELGMEPEEVRKRLRSYRELADLITETVRKLW